MATLSDKVCDFVTKNAIFSAVISPVRGWLHMHFLLRAGNMTIFKELHHHRKQKNARVAAALKVAFR